MISDQTQLSDEPTSPTLVVALRNGESDAWHRLVRVYGPLVVRWCERCGLQPSDAMDVSQDVLLGVDRSLKGFTHSTENGSFRGWLWTITRNKIADFRQHSHGKPIACGGTGALSLLHALPDQSPESREDIADMHLRALDGLRLSFGETTWLAFWRVVVEGDHAKDVAEDLGISVWAVYKARTRILAKLKAELGEDGGMSKRNR